MPYFSETSYTRLETCHPDLQLLAREVIKIKDCTVIFGHRDEADQNRAFDEGKSKVKWPGSKHNKLPSDALDLAPWPLDWRDWKSFYFLGGIVMAKAHDLGIPIRWGGDWDGDGDLKDQNFYDLAHFELKEK